MSKQELASLDQTALAKKLQEKEITIEEFQAALAAQQQAEREKGNVGIQKISVSEKGCLSVKLRSQVKFPTSLYAFQWVQVMTNLGEVVDGLYENQKQLAFKEGQKLPSREELIESIIASLKAA